MKERLESWNVCECVFYTTALFDPNGSSNKEKEGRGKKLKVPSSFRVRAKMKVFDPFHRKRYTTMLRENCQIVFTMDHHDRRQKREIQKSFMCIVAHVHSEKKRSAWIN